MRYERTTRRRRGLKWVGEEENGGSSGSEKKKKGVRVGR